MILLSKAQEILLMQFPEERGERLGAQVGQTLPEDHFRETERISVGVEFEGALDGLVAQGLLERIPGRGTFGTKPLIDMQMRLSSFSEEMERRGKVPTCQSGCGRALRQRSARPPDRPRQIPRAAYRT